MRIFAIMTLTFAAVFGLAVRGGHHGAPGAGASSSPPASASASASAAVSDDYAHAEPGTVVIHRDTEDPHFFVGGDVEGRHLNFVVDTGASTVAMSMADARTLGIDTGQLQFDGQAQTAAGVARVAHVTLPRLRVGDIQLMEVSAAVIDTPQGIPMLGQSFLGRLDRVSIEGDTMTLTKN
jgi:aspartyl protease family protein